MAFLTGAAIRGAVSAVKQGVKAHNDFASGETPAPTLDRYGNPKKNGVVYDYVMKSEQKRAAKKGDGNGGPEISETPGVQPQPQGRTEVPRRRSIEKSEYKAMDEKGDGLQASPAYGDAPPSYDAVTSNRAPSGFGGGSMNTYNPSPNQHPSQAQREMPNTRSDRQSSESSSDLSSSSEDSTGPVRQTRGPTQIGTGYPNEQSSFGQGGLPTRSDARRARKMEKRERRAERRLERTLRRNERSLRRI